MSKFGAKAGKDSAPAFPTRFGDTFSVRQREVTMVYPDFLAN